MEKKTSSVDWLVDKLTYEGEFGARFNSFRDGVDLSEIIQQAKEMHREEIKNAYWEGGQDIPIRDFKCDNYYNETYGSTKQD